MPICNRFHDRLANNGQRTTFRGNRSLWGGSGGKGRAGQAMPAWGVDGREVNTFPQYYCSYTV